MTPRSDQQCWLYGALGMSTFAAFYDFGLAVFHLFFWKLFGWPTMLAPSGRINRGVTQALNIMLIYVFVTYGIVVLLQPSAALLWGGAGFWLLRALVQPALFGLRSSISNAFTGLFVLGAFFHVCSS